MLNITSDFWRSLRPALSLTVELQTLVTLFFDVYVSCHGVRPALTCGQANVTLHSAIFINCDNSYRYAHLKEAITFYYAEAGFRLLSRYRQRRFA